MPVSPSTTTSGMPPAVVATIGLPQAIASSSDVPSPSVTELITKMSNALCSDRTSGAEAGQQDVLLEVMLLDLALERRRAARLRRR